MIRNRGEWYGWDGRMMIRALTSNDSGDRYTYLGIDTPLIHAMDDANMVTLQAPMTPLLPKPTWACTASPRPPNDPNCHASPILDMGQHGHQVHFFLRCHHHHQQQQQQPPIPIPITSRTLHQLYDHHHTYIPVFNNGESHGGSHFPWRIQEWAGGGKQEGEMKIRSPTTNE